MEYEPPSKDKKAGTLKRLKFVAACFVLHEAMHLSLSLSCLRKLEDALGGEVFAQPANSLSREGSHDKRHDDKNDQGDKSDEREEEDTEHFGFD